MLKHETIDGMITGFMHIMNQLKVLRRRYTNAEMVKKFSEAFLRLGALK